MTMIKKWFAGLTLGMSVLALAACGGADEAADKNETPDSQEEAATEEGAETVEMPEPDLEGVPNVVAEVNGEEVTKEEFETVYTAQFQQASMQSQMTGEELDQDQLKKMVADSIVGQKLLIQEAGNRDFTASDEAVETMLNDLTAQNGMETSDDLLAALKEQGMSEEEIMGQIETQVKLDALLAEEAGDTEPTEEEVRATYDQLKAQQEEAGGEEMPAYEEVKPTLFEQLKQQKAGQAAQTLVAKLREQGDVTINL
ncbi:SurA N-terminal domain-containing protein [Planomicrobium sp. YIM 101495]|uniref:SurA N-terminal domain-containing protein n=1 Tax=Planomicrobium sp. YIM 101495 TaxID=2665160 RepID=UPI003519EA73